MSLLHSLDTLRFVLMKPTVLAIDASNDTCSVALSWAGQYFHRESDVPRGHAQNLLPMIDLVLGEADAKLNDLDFFALANGPGSFTGVRIALSIIQGLAYGSQKPVFCLSSLETMAHQFFIDQVSAHKIHVVTALDARMDELYWALYTFDLTVGITVEQIAPQVSGKESFIQDVNEYVKAIDISEMVVGLGHGFAALNDDHIHQLNCIKETDAAFTLNAVALLDYTLKQSKAQRRLFAAGDIEPLYLRNEVSWKKRQRIRSSSI